MGVAAKERTRKVWETLKGREIVEPLLIWLATRIFFYSSAWMLTKVLDLKFSLALFRQLDAGWYLSIIERGYMHEAYSSAPGIGQANWAFFPFLPMLVRVLSTITNLDVLLIAYLVSNLAFLIGLVYLYKYLASSHSRGVIRTTLIFLAMSPVNVYFTSLYSESLFFALLMMMIFYARRQKWIYAGILGAMLSGTRNTGVFMMIIYIFEFIRIPELRSTYKRQMRFFAGLALFPLGLILFMLHLHSLTGDPLAFYHVQTAWSTSGVTFFSFLGGVVPIQSNYGLFSIAVLLIVTLSVIYLAIKRRFTDFLVLLPITLISLLTLRIQYRFYFALYPMYLIASVLLQRCKWLMRLCYVVEIPVLIYAIKLWITGNGLT